ncbi:hypothetical protein [Archangium violaceum]
MELVPTPHPYESFDTFTKLRSARPCAINNSAVISPATNEQCPL